MKKFNMLPLSIVLLATTFFWTSCLKTDDGGWTDDEKASYQEVLSLQDEVSNNLDEWFLNMDSLDAIDMAHQSFANAPNVSEAFVNSQGIAVQYANGMRGGIYLNPLDGETDKSPESLLNDLQANNNMDLKSIVNKRKMILLNPHYWERSYFTDQIYSISRSNLNRAGIDLSTLYKNEEATVDRFTELSGYGIIQIYSHGWAWPKQENITDIYLLTGETANETTSKKYWNELKTGNIPVTKIAGRNNSYLISERFIENYNDFSNDTVLFYGGFCYSFLGDWPDLVESFADGAYFGFDWKVYTYRNANWSVNLMALMSDTSELQPINTETWMSDSDVEKSYWNSQDERTVHIYYTGDGNLTLWGDVSVNLIAMSSDGTPVSKPGEAGVAYPFKCEVVSNISELDYVWDMGDGSSSVTTSNEVEITWDEDGQYELKVDVKDKSNGNIIGTAKADVQIGDQDVKEFVSSCNNMVFLFGPRYALVWENGRSGDATKGYGDFEWYNNLVWSGLSFTGTLTADDNSYTNNVTGNISGDGQKVSFVVEQNSYDSNSDTHSYYKFTVENYPLDYFNPPSSGNGWASYSVEESQDIQNYVTSFEGRNWDDSGYSMHVSGINWESISVLRIGFYQD